MKKSMKIAGLSFLASILIFAGCKKNSSTPALDLVSLNADNIALDGPTPATGVAATATIKAVFTAPVTKATATTSNVKLSAYTLSSDKVDVPVSITLSGDTMIIKATNGLLTGQKYSLALSGLSSGGGEAYSLTVSFSTTGIGLFTVPEFANQVLYLQFNGNITDLTGNAVDSFAQVAYTTDRFGNANAAANFRGASTNGNGDIVELSGNKLINQNMTLSVWIKADLADYPAGGNKAVFGLDVEKGMCLELQPNLNFIKFFTDHIVTPDPDHHVFAVQWADGSSDQGYVVNGTDYTENGGKIANLYADQWSQFVLTYDVATTTKRIYINGTKVFESVTTPNPTAEWNLAGMAIDTTVNKSLRDFDKLTLGFYCSRKCSIEGWANYSNQQNSFKGLMDDFRIWNVALSGTEVATLYTSEKP